MIDSIVASDPELRDLRRKIDASYVTKERARQQAEQQVRGLELKAEEAKREAEMVAAGVREQQKREQERREKEERERQAQKEQKIQMEGRKEL